MILLGLTGSIAMGKSRAAERFRAFGVPVFDADGEVHALLALDGAAVASIAAAFPGCIDAAGGVDREALGQAVLGRPQELRRLEAMLHPLVRASQDRFLRRATRAGTELVVLDTPLLFETGGERRVDAVAVVSASTMLQAQRALRRPGMTAARLAGIRARQLPDWAKRRRADYVIPSGFDGGALARHVGAIIADLRGRTAQVWPPRWHCAALKVPCRPSRPD